MQLMFFCIYSEIGREARAFFSENLRGKQAKPPFFGRRWVKASGNLCGRKRVTILFSFTHMPSALLLLRQRRVAAGSGLSTGLGTTIKNVRTY
jgi:hypothetical protein